MRSPVALLQTAVLFSLAHELHSQRPNLGGEWKITYSFNERRGDKGVLRTSSEGHRCIVDGEWFGVQGISLHHLPARVHFHTITHSLST